MTSPAQFGPTPLSRTLEAALRDLKSSKGHIRQAAAQDLSWHIDSPARSAVVQQLNQRVVEDPSVEVRVAALLALTNGGAKESVELIVQMALVGPARVRQIALLALAELAEPGHQAAIDAALKAVGSPLAALRYQGLVTLQALKGRGAIKVICSSLIDQDSEVRWVAVRLIEEMSTHPNGPVTDVGPLQADVEVIIKAVRPLLKDRVPKVALVATVLLACLNDEVAIQQLPAWLSRTRPKLDLEDELAAIELVGQFGLASATGDLQRRAWPFLWEGPTTWAARVALSQLGDERARGAVLQDLNSDSPFKCARAIEAAGKIGLEQARARLKLLLSHPSDFDVDAIESALKRLGP